MFGTSGYLVPWLMIAAGELVALLGGLWLVIPNLYGLPWVPARYLRIRRALEMVGTQPGDTVYDLGAGDGRALPPPTPNASRPGCRESCAPEHESSA